MANYKLPDENDIKNTLAMILGEEVGLTEQELFAKDEASYVALYQNSEAENVALCYCDWPLAAGLGAALSMISPGAAEEMAAERKLTDSAVANLYEVMNIISSLYMSDSTKHLKLTEVLPTSSNDIPELDGEVLTLGYELSIGKYGNGSIAFLAT